MTYDKILHAVTDPLTLAALALLLAVAMIRSGYRSLTPSARHGKFNSLIGLAALFVVGAFVLVAFQLTKQIQTAGGTTQTVGTGNAVADVKGGVSIGGGCPEPTNAVVPSTPSANPLPAPGKVDQRVESGNAVSNVGGNVNIQQPAPTPDGKAR